MPGARILRDVSIAKKLYGTAAVLLVFLALVGVLGISNLSSSSALGSDTYLNATVPIEQLDAARASLGNVDKRRVAVPPPRPASRPRRN